MQERKIHVTGTGHAVKSPDFVVLSLTLSAQNKEYSDAVKLAAQQIEMLRESIAEAGFDADDLKTNNFNVEAKYDSEEFRDGNTKRYREIFIGFECRHDLTLSFDFDGDKLDAALSALATCLSQPKIFVSFKLKDKSALSDEILKAAAKDARRKAEVLCAASGVKLGKLVEINYAPDEFSSSRTILDALSVPGTANDAAFNFSPKELTATDTAEFFWEIE
ncbi:MAG: SIMPL domain-containing protein [Selenomonadaceae bacterium]|nr:SIMPL domain-containing protein [Selenomonadaceae bacterium]